MVSRPDAAPQNHHCLNPQNSMVWHEAVLGWIQKWTDPAAGREAA